MSSLQRQPLTVIEDDLNVGARIADGIIASIYDIDTEQSDFVYKKYKDSAALNDFLKDRSANITALIDLGRNYNPSSTIQDNFGWPISRVVGPTEEVTGLLLWRAPEKFFAALLRDELRARDFNYLIYEERSLKTGIPPTSIDEKLRLFRRLAELLLWLEQNGLVHEDLAAQNILWAVVDSQESIFILDCDSIHKHDGHSSEKYLITTQEWTDPRVVKGEVSRPDFASMSYGLGLVVGRVLDSPYWAPPEGGEALNRKAIPASLLPTLNRSMLGQGRPTLQEWIESLNRAVSEVERSTKSVKRATAKMAAPMKVGGFPYSTWTRIAFTLGMILGGSIAYLLIERYI